MASLKEAGFDDASCEADMADRMSTYVARTSIGRLTASLTTLEKLKGSAQ